MAVVNFTNEDGSVSDEITSDFKITGEFNVLNYVSNNSIESGAAQYTISGSVSSDPVSGQMQIDYQLLNNTTNQVLLSQTAAFNKKFQRKAIHAIDDNIYKKIN